MENLDPEIKAMAQISDALSQLEPDAIRRILRWANERFQVKVSATTTGGQAVVDLGQSPRTYAEFHELFDVAKPTTGVEEVLVSAYWFQVVQAHPDLDSFMLNKELKNLGRGSSNITRDLDNLINRDPRLVMQVGKEGGRRRYKLTMEGIRAVQKLMGNKQGSDNTQ